MELSVQGGHTPEAHEEVERLATALVGRRIVEVIDGLPTKDPGWSDHGSVMLVFDDGARLNCGGWGHDAWGPDLAYEGPLS